MVYTDAIKQQEAMMFMTKKQAQLLLLAAGVLMLLFGLWRGMGSCAKAPETTRMGRGNRR